MTSRHHSHYCASNDVWSFWSGNSHNLQQVSNEDTVYFLQNSGIYLELSSL